MNIIISIQHHAELGTALMQSWRNAHAELGAKVERNVESRKLFKEKITV